MENKSESDNMAIEENQENKTNVKETATKEISTEIAIVNKKKLSQGAGGIKKKRKKKDSAAPKFPLTGYVRYINDKREEMRNKNPGLSAIEITKLLAEDWNKMPDNGKTPYLQAAELDKKRYYKEIGEYKEAKKASEAEESLEQPKSNKNKLKPSSHILTNNTSLLNGKDTTSPPAKIKTGDIPIFTDEFLEHNKVIDSELRLLRKSNTDYEQQNAVLEKHVENMQNGIDKLETEITSIRENNSMLETYIDKLKRKLAVSFAGLSLPGHPKGATIDNIEGYVVELQTMSATNSHPPATINKAKDIIRKLDINIQI